MSYDVGRWLEACFGFCMPISMVIAFLDLLVNTCLNLAFIGFDTLKVRSIASIHPRSKLDRGVMKDMVM